jgi:hypothetical protein
MDKISVSAELITGTWVVIPKPKHLPAVEAALLTSEAKRKQHLTSFKVALQTVADTL